MSKPSTDMVPLLNSDISPSIQDEFVREWIQTEETFKSLEKFQGVLLVPAYMGLRNSGRYFVQALSELKNGEKELALVALNSSVEELRRSRHDALRAQIDFCHFKLLLIEESYPSERIFQVCPEYFDLNDEMEEVNVKLNSDFGDLREADEYFKKLEKEYLPKLLTVFSKLTTAREVALEDIKRNDMREERYKKLAVAGFAVGVVGLILAVVAFLV